MKSVCKEPYQKHDNQRRKPKGNMPIGQHDVLQNHDDEVEAGGSADNLGDEEKGGSGLV